ncbi:MAG: hypothetical protein HN509_15890 [Halobacteriovoraceae bacterium]|jgi:hypothetical protein|nr:hypothetical protein [Halobacteriovoraceae bacterium]MBT5094312.1 hypothetical protein [Halobacteriovoraceae bacterium]
MRAALFISLLAIWGLVGAAHARDGYSSRYTTSYSTWDSGFGSHYSYSERTTTTTTTTTTTYNQRCGGFNTCYNGYTSTSNVYVQETIIESGSFRGYTEVTVYNDRRYRDSDRYVTYYTHPHQGRRRVVRRRYHRTHPHYNSYYHHSAYSHYGHSHWHQVDQFTAEIILGMEFINLGASVLSTCGSDDTVCQALGIASSVSGSLISISASLREIERTDLQRAIEAKEKSKEETNLEDSLDEIDLD